MAEEEKLGWFESLFVDNEEVSPKEREMVRAPTPPPPEFVQAEGESDMDFRLRKKREMRAYNKLLRDMEASPENFMVPAAAAEAEPTEELSRYDRKAQLEAAERELGTQ